MRTLTPQEALIFVMVTMAAADSALSESELARIGHIVDTMPVFNGFPRDHIVETANRCTALLHEETGIDQILAMVKESLPEKYYDTAYAVGTDVAAADLEVRQEELHFLELLRDEFDLDELVVAAIKRAARARFRLA